MKIPFLAARHNRKAIEAEEAGDIAGAIALYEKAMRADPRWSVPWYNLGLLYKRQHDWPESLRCNARAVELDPKDEAGWWNLGIAATALGRWADARRAWTAFGIQIADGEGEIAMNFGATPIRINPDTNAEVIWTHRIDPARAVITSVPLPESDHRHGDLLLHDGVPVGERMLNGRAVSVFDELEILQRSPLGTFEVTIEANETGDLDALETLFIEADYAAEDWSTIRWLCDACSKGRPDAHEEHQHARAGGEHRYGLAAPDLATVNELLSRWMAAGEGRTAEEVSILLPPLPVQ